MKLLYNANVSNNSKEHSDRNFDVFQKASLADLKKKWLRDDVEYVYVHCNDSSGEQPSAKWYRYDVKNDRFEHPLFEAKSEEGKIKQLPRENNLLSLLLQIESDLPKIFKGTSITLEDKTAQYFDDAAGSYAPLETSNQNIVSNNTHNHMATRSIAEETLKPNSSSSNVATIANTTAPVPPENPNNHTSKSTAKEFSPSTWALTLFTKKKPLVELPVELTGGIIDKLRSALEDYKKQWRFKRAIVHYFAPQTHSKESKAKAANDLLDYLSNPEQAIILKGNLGPLTNGTLFEAICTSVNRSPEKTKEWLESISEGVTICYNQTSTQPAHSPFGNNVV